MLKKFETLRSINNYLQGLEGLYPAVAWQVLHMMRMTKMSRENWNVQEMKSNLLILIFNVSFIIIETSDHAQYFDPKIYFK